MKPASAPYCSPDVRVEGREDVVEPEPEQEVGDHVLDEDHRGLQPGEALHLRVDEDLHQLVDVLGDRRHARP